MAQGSVPAAVAGKVDANGVRSGIFEDTIIVNKRYTTRLTLVNQPLTIKHGTNAGFVGLDVFDFPKALMNWVGGVADLVITKGTGAYALTSDHDGFIALGTTTNIDQATMATTYQNLLPTTAYAAVADVVASADAKSATANLIQLDGTGTAKSAFFNMLVDTSDEFQGSVDNSVILLNGTISFTWEDLGQLD